MLVLDITLRGGYNFNIQGSTLSAELVYQCGLLGLDINEADDVHLDTFALTMGLVF